MSSAPNLPDAIVIFVLLATFLAPALAFWPRRRAAWAQLDMRPSSLDRVAADLATFYGAGHSPKAPGTVGSLASLPFAWVLARIPALPWRLAIIGTSFAVATLAVNRYMALRKGAEDPQEVVVDEVLGMWIALLFVPFELPWVAGAFLAFRLFDIAKPGPVGWADRRVKGALGVMLDDGIAGLFAGLLLAGIARFLAS